MIKDLPIVEFVDATHPTVVGSWGKKEFLNGNEIVHTIREKRLGEPFIKLFLTKIVINDCVFIENITKKLLSF